MRRRTVTAATLALLGFASGIAIGLVTWTRYQDRNATSLYSSKARRRLAALSRLSALDAQDATVDTVATLREYVAWERHPILRRRGKDLLTRLVSNLT